MKTKGFLFWPFLFADKQQPNRPSQVFFDNLDDKIKKITLDLKDICPIKPHYSANNR